MKGHDVTGVRILYLTCVYMLCQNITCEPQNRLLFGTRKRLVNGGEAEFNQETDGYRHLRI